MTRRHAAARRDILGSAGAFLMLATAEAGPTKAAELDGALLHAFRRWQPYERERVAMCALTGEEAGFEARFDAYTRPWHALMFEIMSEPARTPEGVAAKATVLRALLENHAGCGDDPPDASTTEQFAWSLVTDMLGRSRA